MKKETIVIILLCVLLVAEAAARNSGQNRTIGGSVGNIVDTLIKLFA